MSTAMFFRALFAIVLILDLATKNWIGFAVILIVYVVYECLSAFGRLFRS